MSEPDWLDNADADPDLAKWPARGWPKLLAWLCVAAAAGLITAVFVRGCCV